MKGIIKETPAGWFVWYQVMRDGVTSGYDSIPLHPGDLDEIWDGKAMEFEIVKENVDTGALEAPYIKVEYAKLIATKEQTNGERFDEFMRTVEVGSEVEPNWCDVPFNGKRIRFENLTAEQVNYLITVSESYETSSVRRSALLPEIQYPELEGTMNLCNDIIEKRSGKMTEEEWQAAERAQTGTKQETLEEAALKYLKSKCVKMYPEEIRLFVAGAKWQKEQTISDEEIEKGAKEWYNKEGIVNYKAEIRAWVSACKWYREQIKSKK